MANRDFTKIERILKDFSLNIGGGNSNTPEGLVIANLQNNPEGDNLICPMSLEEIMETINEKEQCILLVYDNPDNNKMYYAIIYNIFQNDDDAYIIYFYSFNNSENSGSIVWNTSFQEFLFNNGAE